MNKDLAELKTNNPIGEVIQEAGFILQPGDDGLLIGLDGLTVDTSKGRYSWKERNEKGDVIGWLMARFGWTFGQAIQYLENRLKLLPEARVIHSQAEPLPGKELDKVKTVTELAPGLPVMNDSRLQEAERLGFDLSRSIIEIVDLGLSGVIAYFGWLPRLFIPLFGDLSEIEICSYCYKDFGEWDMSGAAFVAVEIGNSYELKNENGIYCLTCVKRFQRFAKVQGLIEAYLIDRITGGGFESVGAAAGKSHNFYSFYQKP